MMQIDVPAEAFAIEVGVNLGRDDRLVPEHLLHLTDTRAALVANEWRSVCGLICFVIPAARAASRMIW